MVRHHHQQHGQREIGVVQRALLADSAEARVRRLAPEQRRRDLALVRDDHHEDIGRHDGADDDADMDEGAAAREEMREDVGEAEDQREDAGREEACLLPDG